jgi:hypothetical protein
MDPNLTRRISIHVPDSYSTPFHETVLVVKSRLLTCAYFSFKVLTEEEMPTIIWHGSYGLESPRDDVRQVRYGCTDCESENQGYMEILHVENPPPGRESYLVHYLMHFPKDRKRDKPTTIRIEICCKTREIADRIWETLGRKFSPESLLAERIIHGREVRHLTGEELPWAYES